MTGGISWADNEGSTLSRNTERRAMVRLESILERDNLNKAMRQVIANKGSAGIDGMEVAELRPYLMAHHPEITKAVREGKYKPSPVRRVQIPKEERGKTQPLGIPTVIDRFIQQAVAQRLSQAYEQWFSPNSHGFRPDRGCHTAINQALAYANSGKCWVVDLDLEKFFDTVNHAKLIQVLSERIKDGRVISLIHKMLRAPVSENGKVTKTEILCQLLYACTPRGCQHPRAGRFSDWRRGQYFCL